MFEKVGEWFEQNREDISGIALGALIGSAIFVGGYALGVVDMTRAVGNSKQKELGNGVIEIGGVLYEITKK